MFRSLRSVPTLLIRDHSLTGSTLSRSLSNLAQRVEYRSVDSGQYAQMQPDIIYPSWVSEPGPQADLSEAIIVIPDSHQKNILQNEQVKNQMQAAYENVGLVYVRNTGLTDAADMRKLAQHVMQNEMIYEGGSNPRDSFSENVYDVGAPLISHLHYHHEMAYIGESTRNLAFMSIISPGEKGSTYVSDSVAATKYALTTDLGKKLKDLGVCYRRDMTDAKHFEGKIEEGVYNHWQKSMGTEDMEEAEAIAQAKGLVTEWGPDRKLKTRYYADAYEYFAPLDKNLLYCSVADHGVWFDSWPLVQHLPYHERPLDMTFGDDTPFTREELKEFIHLYDMFGMKLDWQVGDVAIICNYRWAHGRPAIHLEEGEDRRIGVMLGEKYPRVGQFEGKW